MPNTTEHQRTEIQTPPIAHPTAQPTPKTDRPKPQFFSSRSGQLLAVLAIIAVLLLMLIALTSIRLGPIQTTRMSAPSINTTTS